jgi:hypothetical protein
MQGEHFLVRNLIQLSSCFFQLSSKFIHTFTFCLGFRLFDECSKIFHMHYYECATFSTACKIFSLLRAIITQQVMEQREILDSISSRFNVLNMPISTTAPIDAKTHV